MDKRIKKVDCVLEEQQFRNLLASIIRGHRFLNKGVSPKAIVVPRIDIVEGVAIVYKELDIEDIQS